MPYTREKELIIYRSETIKRVLRYLVMAKILVTGGAGFIGSHLVDSLIAEGHHVTAIDDLSIGKKEFVNPKAELVVSSITNDLDKLFTENSFDYVFHLAAQTNLRVSLEKPLEDASVNILGSLNIINQCVKHKVKKIIFSSSGGALCSPHAPLPCTEESLIEPQSPYGIAKFTTEQYLRSAQSTHGLNYVALRYSNVYGPRQNAKGEAGVVAIFINRLLEGKPLTIYSSGEQTRDFIYVADVVSANLLAISIEGIYNVGTQQETSVKQIAEKLQKSLDKKGEINYAPKIAGEVERSCISAQKLMQTGWKPLYSLEQGLQETIAWFKDLKQ